MGLFGKLNPINAKVSVMLDKPMFGDGEPVTGKLIVVSDEDVRADEIRVEINIMETGYSSGGPEVSIGGLTLRGRQQPPKRHVVNRHNERVVLSGPLDVYKGYSGEFPFSMSLPSVVPSMSSGVIERKIKGVVAVKGRPDKTHEINVNVSGVSYGVPVQAPGQVVVREVIKVPCKYCGTLIPVESQRCPTCGARFSK